MTQSSPTSTSASAAEISGALKYLFEAGLPFQRGSTDNTAIAYVRALSGFSIEAINAGIDKFLGGHCDGVSLRYVPTPPELAKIVRTAVVVQRIPPQRQIAPTQTMTAGERARMRLKMPMWQHANATGRMDDLARANREGFAAMVALATAWGVPVPEELFAIPDEEAERQWHTARSRAWSEIERNPPPFMRDYQQMAIRDAA